MNPVRVTAHLERGEKGEDAIRIGNFAHLRFQLYLETSSQLCNLACHLVIVVLGPVRQVKAVVSQGCLMVCVDWLDDGFHLFRRMAISVAACVHQMTTVGVSVLGIIVRLGVGYRISYI